MNRNILTQANGRFTALFALLFGVLTILVTPVGGLAVSQDDTTASYIVQAADLETAVTAVQQVGGELTHELGIINAVGANLTAAQFAVLEKNSDITNLQENRQLQMVGFITETVRDQFSSNSFGGNNGSVNWVGDWQEYDPEWWGTGTSSGAVRVTSGELRLDDNPNTGQDPNAARQVDLSQATSATFSFDYSTSSGVDRSDVIAIEVSADGQDFDVLERIDDIRRSRSGTKSYDISSFASSQTTVRFRVDENYGGSSEYFYVDNVEIEYTVVEAPPPVENDPPVEENDPPVGGGFDVSIRDEFNQYHFAGNDGMDAIDHAPQAE